MICLDLSLKFVVAQNSSTDFWLRLQHFDGLIKLACPFSSLHIGHCVRQKLPSYRQKQNVDPVELKRQFEALLVEG